MQKKVNYRENHGEMGCGFNLHYGTQRNTLLRIGAVTCDVRSSKTSFGTGVLPPSRARLLAEQFIVGQVASTRDRQDAPLPTITEHPRLERLFPVLAGITVKSALEAVAAHAGDQSQQEQEQWEQMQALLDGKLGVPDVAPANTPIIHP